MIFILREFWMMDLTRSWETLIKGVEADSFSAALLKVKSLPAFETATFETTGEFRRRGSFMGGSFGFLSQEPLKILCGEEQNTQNRIFILRNVFNNDDNLPYNGHDTIVAGIKADSFSVAVSKVKSLPDFEKASLASHPLELV
jgi:hypothetical protein